MRLILTLVLLAFSWSASAFVHCPLEATAASGDALAHARDAEHAKSAAAHGGHRSHDAEDHRDAHPSGAHDDHAADCRAAPACTASALIASGMQPAVPGYADRGPKAVDEEYASPLTSIESPPPRPAA